MALIYNASFDSQTRVLSLLDKAGNVISSCEVPSKGNVDDITKPLTFRATQDGSTVYINIGYGSPIGDFQTSRDGGKTWVDYTIGTGITLNTGEEVSFRAKADRTSAQAGGSYFKFTMRGKIEAWHNVMSLYRTNDFATYKTVMQYAFTMLFRECTSLTKAPILPATTLATSCYDSMFEGCTSLTNAPVLPVTTLADYCYFCMFRGCASLTKAPLLPATTLADRCYGFMFNGCSSLNEVHCKMPSLYSSSQISSYADTWLSGVSSTGTFYTNEDANWSSGVSGIPTGWQRVNEGAPDVDDITKPLTLTATVDNSTVKLLMSGTVRNTFEVDKGNGWEDYTINTVIPLNAGESCKWRCKSHPSTQTDSRYVRFGMTGTIEASGNCNSMLSSDFENMTSLSNSKYDYAFVSLFKNCTPLTKAPLLPATILPPYGYFHMFEGCKSLTEVRISATKTATGAFTQWLSGVSATGDFYCDPNAKIFPSGSSGIPSGWNRKPLSDYPVTP